MTGWKRLPRPLTGERRDAAKTAAILAGLLMLPLAFVFAGAAEGVRWPVLALGAGEVGLVVGAIGALLPRRAAGATRDRVRVEIAGALAVVLAVAAGVALAASVGSSLAWLAGSSRVRLEILLTTPFVLGALAIPTTTAAYVLVRTLVLTWPRWDRLRRRRLLWAIAHALLVASLSVAVGVAALLIAVDLATGTFGPVTVLPEAERLGVGPFQETAVWLTVRVAPAVLALVLLSLVVGVVIVPPAALISFPVVRRATRRLEDLAAAAGALRGGDLSARSPMSGEDEIASLQADFNAMAAELERSRDALRAERDAVSRLLNERRELIATVSHELRTPVATLRGYLESARAHWDDEPPPSLRHDLEIMSGETERLHRLIDDLFTLARADVDRLPLTVAPTPVAPLLERAAAAAAGLAWERGRVEVVASPPGDLPLVLADPTRLEQIVRNLVSNAVRHTPPGGLVLLTAEAAGDFVVIQVRDTGEGIAAPDVPRVWDRFYRATGQEADRGERREGAGLGLALVKELTEAMGGSVAVESAPGEGSYFSVRLPVARISGGAPTRGVLASHEG